MELSSGCKILGIVEGMSSSGSIRFQAGDYFSRAWVDKKTGEIKSEVKRFWWPARFYNAHPRFPLSRLVRSMTRMMVLQSWKAAAAIIAMILVMSYVMFLAMLVSPENGMAVNRSFESGIGWVYPFILVSILAGFKKNAGWHGAMNMALAAYNERGRTDLVSIAKEDYIYSKASDRFYIPLAAAAILAWAIAVILSADRDMTYMVVAEAFLWVDYLKGFGTVPLASRASRLFQEKVSAKPPEGIQILVAQQAMLALVEGSRKKA